MKSKKTTKEKPFKSKRDIQIQEAVELSKKPVKSLKSKEATLPYTSILYSLRIGEED